MGDTRHVLEAQQFDIPRLLRLFAATDEIKRLFKTPRGTRKLRKLLAGKQMYVLFYEPSLRTRTSFSKAGIDLGMDVLYTEDASQFSSAVKGETLEHTVRVLCGYRFDVIELRHPTEGSAKRAADVIDYYSGLGEIKPVVLVNGGDGKGQHPTQALLDVYTIQNELGRLNDLTVVMGGDLKHGRTCRSLAYLLSKFKGTRFIFVSPPAFPMGKDILDHLDKHHVPYHEETDLFKALSSADVVYWTRTQTERLSGEERALDVKDYHIGEKEASWMKPGAILMHPLPIGGGEIAPEVDKLHRAAYFRQADNGLPIRMALLCEAFDVPIPA